MLTLLIATLVGFLFATGTFLVLRRGEIRLILGLALLSHGVNILLFGTSNLQRREPPVLDKANLPVDFSQFADPLPQALILTAIVISFGITAFIVVLVNRRNNLHEADAGAETAPRPAEVQGAEPDYYLNGLDPTDDDYTWLVYRSAQNRGAQPSGDAAGAAPQLQEPQSWH